MAGAAPTAARDPVGRLPAALAALKEGQAARGRRRAVLGKLDLQERHLLCNTRGGGPAWSGALPRPPARLELMPEPPLGAHLGTVAEALAYGMDAEADLASKCYWRRNQYAARERENRASLEEGRGREAEHAAGAAAPSPGRPSSRGGGGPRQVRADAMAARLEEWRQETAEVPPAPWPALPDGCDLRAPGATWGDEGWPCRGDAQWPRLPAVARGSGLLPDDTAPPRPTLPSEAACGARAEGGAALAARALLAAERPAELLELAPLLERRCLEAAKEDALRAAVCLGRAGAARGGGEGALELRRCALALLGSAAARARDAHGPGFLVQALEAMAAAGVGAPRHVDALLAQLHARLQRGEELPRPLAVRGAGALAWAATALAGPCDALRLSAAGRAAVARVRAAVAGGPRAAEGSLELLAALDRLAAS